MTDWPILSTITFLPLLGAFFILLIRGDEATAANNAKAVALWTSVVTLFLTGFMVSQFDGSSAAFQFVERINWLGDGVDYAMGVDGISVLFVLLTAALMPICILASWHSGKPAIWQSGNPAHLAIQPRASWPSSHGPSPEPRLAQSELGSARSGPVWPRNAVLTR